MIEDQRKTIFNKRYMGKHWSLTRYSDSWYHCYEFNGKIYFFFQNGNSLTSPHFFMINKSLCETRKIESQGYVTDFHINENKSKKHLLAAPEKYKAWFGVIKGCVSEKYMAILVEELAGKIKGNENKKHCASPISVYIYEKGQKSNPPKRYFVGYPQDIDHVSLLAWRDKFVVVWLEAFPHDKKMTPDNPDPTVDLKLSLIDPKSLELKTIVLKRVHWNANISADILDDNICIAYHLGMGTRSVSDNKIKTMFLNLNKLFDKDATLQVKPTVSPEAIGLHPTE